MNQPLRPCTQRAAASAPCANVARSRTVCVSASVSACASKPTVCVPGMKPARVDDTSIARGKPPRSTAFLSVSAVPEGASFLAEWCASWMKAP